MPPVQGLHDGPHPQVVVRRVAEEVGQVERARGQRERRGQARAEGRRRGELRGDAPVAADEVEAGGVEHRGDDGAVVDGDARRRRRRRRKIPSFSSSSSSSSSLSKGPLPEDGEARLHEVADEDVRPRQPRRLQQPLVGHELVALGGQAVGEEVEVLPGEDVAPGRSHECREALFDFFFFRRRRRGSVSGFFELFPFLCPVPLSPLSQTKKKGHDTLPAYPQQLPGGVVMDRPPLDAVVGEVGLGRFATSPSSSLSSFSLSSFSAPDFDRERAHPGGRDVEKLAHAARAQQRHAGPAGHELARDAGDDKRVRRSDGERRDEVAFPNRRRGGQGGGGLEGCEVEGGQRRRRGRGGRRRLGRR